MAKLQSSWSRGIDLEGLNETDKKRIKQVGLNQWMDELSAKNEKSVTEKKSKEVMPSAPMGAIKEQSAVTGVHRAETSADPILELAISKLNKTQKQVVAFIKVSKENGGVVTFEQSAKINPKYPADPVYYARKAGWAVETDRKAKVFRVGAYVPKTS
jgi:hypothetical protein